MQRLKLIDSDGGAIAVIVAISSLMMFGLAALVVDLGMARDERRLAQNTADASALAGAGEMYTNAGVPRFTEATAAVKAYALTNSDIPLTAWNSCTATGPSGYVQAGSGSACILFDSDIKPTKVWVSLPSTRSKSLFGGVFGYSGRDINAVAEGKIANTSTSGCALCVLRELKVENGQAMVFGGGSVVARDIEVKRNGKISVSPPGSINSTNPASPLSNPDRYSPNPPNSGVAVVDPFQGAAMPPLASWPTTKYAGTTVCGKNNGTDILNPGVYELIRVQNGTCRLTDGLYLITDRLDMSGNDAGQLLGDNVTLYFVCGSVDSPRVCSSGESGGELDATGKGKLSITAWSWPEFSILYHPDNDGELKLAGNGAGNYIGGAIYARSAEFELKGNAHFGEVRRSVVVGEADIDGNNPSITIDAPGLTPTFILGRPSLSR